MVQLPNGFRERNESNMAEPDKSKLSKLTSKEGSNRQLIGNSSVEGSKSDIKTASIDDVYKTTTEAYEFNLNKTSDKYRETLKHFVPLRSKRSPNGAMPVDEAGCLSFLFFSWITPLIWKSYRRGLRNSDVYNCSPLDSSRVNCARLSNIWEEECRSYGLHNASLCRAWFKMVRTRVFVAALFYLFCLVFGYLSATLFMKKLLDYVESDDEDIHNGIWWAVALLVCELARSSCFAIMYGISIRTATRAKSGVSALLYKKLLRSRSLCNKSVGEFVNLFANDTFKVYHMVYTLPLIIGGPVIVLVTIVYTACILGIFALVGVGVFICAFGLQYYISRLINYLRKRAIRATDDRVSLMTELLTYIKLIKLYAWEVPFTETVFKYRKKEHALIEKCQYLQCLSTSLALIVPIIITIATILAYTVSKNNLSAVQAFTLVMVNYVAAHGIRILPISIRDIIQGRIALKRIERVLQYDDRDNYIVLPVDLGNAIELKKATLAWDTIKESSSNDVSKSNAGANRKSSSREPGEMALMGDKNNRTSFIPPMALYDVTLSVPKGRLVGIIGNIGSGKSSLIQAIMGQLLLVTGKVGVRGNIAYVPQQPWLLNATLRGNITFGYPFESKRYYEAVYSCGLNKDMAELPAGDQTEIGERGVNLSGGQKSRISLARAFYANKDIYLLDDSLSSVDRVVGRHIFTRLIKGALKRKTVLFVTHQIEFLQEMDTIVFVEEGKVVSVGSHQELMTSDVEYQRLVANFQNNEPIAAINEPDLLPDTESEPKESQVRFSSQTWGDVQPLSFHETSSKSTDTSRLSDAVDLKGGQLVPDEFVAVGRVSTETYAAYFRAAGSWYWLLFLFLWYIVLAANIMFTNWWLGYWISQGSGFNETTPGISGNIILNPHLHYYQSIYLASIGSLIAAALVLGVLFTKTTLRASSFLHQDLFLNIFKSPMSIFETNPVGRIQNIFTRDIDEVDNHVPQALDGFLQRLMIVGCNLVIVILVYPWFAAPLMALAVIFIFVHLMFRGAMRDLKRIESAARSPIYSHINATIQGISVVKAFHKQEEFIKRFTDLLDNQLAPYFLYFCSMRWLSTRMDVLCVLITFIAALFSILYKHQVGVAMAGLAISLSMQLSGMFQYVVRLGCDVETRFTSVERILMYIYSFEKEQEDVKLIQVEPPSEWPTRGRISFRDVRMRYRPGLPLALRGISLEIEAQEKVGIVGRTGAGKSSVASVLFRLVELCSGSIHIDGVDISTINLQSLRSKITIIPQDPVLFRGSIRYNLDPFNSCQDDELMDALSRVHMRVKVAALPKGLNTDVAENGDNFSSGERQLFCMARALLRSNKILILDEATASMDPETDLIVQDTIQNVFGQCTVITIAHRLQSVLKCDRVLVLKDGKAVEFESPSKLLSMKESLFAQMIPSLEST